MAYCVHCGVELAHSEKKCPLCQTVVVDPAPGTKAPEPRPYPDTLEAVGHKINKRYGAHLVTIALAVPSVLSLLCDLLTSGGFSWSLYVVGACLCLFVYGVLPMYFEKARVDALIASDTLATLVFLLLIAWRTNGLDWGVSLALPLCLTAGLLADYAYHVFLNKRIRGLNKAAAIVVVVSVLLILVEMFIDNFQFGQIELRWSLYALVPLLASAAMLGVIERRARLKEEIRKRLFL